MSAERGGNGACGAVWMEPRDGGHMRHVCVLSAGHAGKHYCEDECEFVPTETVESPDGAE